MAMRRQIGVGFGDMGPAGAFLAGEVEPVMGRAA